MTVPPNCPEGCGATGVPVSVAEGRFYAPKDGREARLFCPACGQAWHGSDAEVWSARNSEAAHQRQLEREHKQAKETAKEREMREKLERAMRGEW